MKNGIEILELTGVSPSSRSFVEYYENLKTVDQPTIKVHTSGETNLELLGEGRNLVHLRVPIKSGKKIEVWMCGSGKPVLLVPGLGVSAQSWLNQIEDFSSEFRAIVIHKPGHGLSETIDDLSYKEIACMMDEVLGILEVKDPVHVVGTCLGGNVAAAFAALFPEHTASLVLANTLFRWNTDVFDDAPLTREKVREIMAFLNALDISLTEDFKLNMSQLSEDHDDYHNRKYDLHKKSRSIDPSANVQYLSFISNDKQLDDVIGNIDRPTLVIVGDKDTIVDISNSKELNQLIKGSRFAGIPNAGHFPHITHPQEFNTIVRDFIQNCEMQSGLLTLPGTR